MIGRGEALEALRRESLGRKFAFATVLEVTDGGPSGFLAHVRSGRRVHPHLLVVAGDESRLSLDAAINELLPVADAQLWARGVLMWLMVQLDTGVLRWGRRVTLPDGSVAIDPMLEPAPASPWWVSPLPLDRPTGAGSVHGDDWRDGRDAAVSKSSATAPLPSRSRLRAGTCETRASTCGRAAHTDGRLVQWLQLHLDDRGRSLPVGQFVVAWQDECEAVVVLECREFEPSVPVRAVEELLLAGVHAAADAGARVIQHRTDNAEHLQRELPWQSDDGILHLRAGDVP